MSLHFVLLFEVSSKTTSAFSNKLGALSENTAKTVRQLFSSSIGKQQWDFFILSSEQPSVFHPHHNARIIYQTG